MAHGQSSTVTVEQAFEDILFARKNRAYGAYRLRMAKNKNLTIALFSATFIFVSTIAWPLLLSKTSVRLLHANNNGTIVITKIDLPKPPEVVVPVEPAQISSGKMIRYVIPEIKPDEQVKFEEFPETKDLKGAAIGTVTRDGTNNETGNELIPVVGTSVVEPEVVEKDIPFESFAVEEVPAFLGGDEALLQYISDNLRYPEIAIRAGVEGLVSIVFLVDKNGKIKDASVIKGIGAGCDEEALRVISSLPDWHPGKQNGRSVTVRMSVPI
ncbi:MAG: energy transducer TonB, partial [Ignavibacteriales bacterium]|nr:energy transducer TonB [Ignavibacteriales bacterium]